MLDIPQEIEMALSLTKSEQSRVAQYAYKLLGSMLERHGLRWDYFVV